MSNPVNLPWRVGDERYGDHVVDSQGSSVCRCEPNRTGGLDATNVNSEHIVRCVNSHSALIASLERLCNVCRVYGENQRGRMYSGVAAGVRGAEELIAAAKGPGDA